MKARRVAGLGLACIALISISTPASAASASASSGSPSELLFSTANVEEVAGLIQSERQYSRAHTSTGPEASTYKPSPLVSNRP